MWVDADAGIALAHRHLSILDLSPADHQPMLSASGRWVLAYNSDYLIHIEVPSADWLTNKIANMVYSLQGLDYVANISPMHSPFHLYEFTRQSFARHAELNEYDIAFSEFQVASTFLPKILDPVVKPIMLATNTGMQLEIWLRKRA